MLELDREPDEPGRLRDDALHQRLDVARDVERQDLGFVALRFEARREDSEAEVLLEIGSDQDDANGSLRFT